MTNSKLSSILEETAKRIREGTEKQYAILIVLTAMLRVLIEIAQRLPEGKHDH